MEHISNYIHISFSFGMNKHIARISHTCAQPLTAAIVQIKSSAAGSVMGIPQMSLVCHLGSSCYHARTLADFSRSERDGAVSSLSLKAYANATTCGFFAPNSDLGVLPNRLNRVEDKT